MRTLIPSSHHFHAYPMQGFDLLDPSHETKALEELPRVTMMTDVDGNAILKNLSTHRANTVRAAGAATTPSYRHIFLSLGFLDSKVCCELIFHLDVFNLTVIFVGHSVVRCCTILHSRRKKR